MKLRIASKLLSVHDKIHITDEYDNPLYEVHTNAITMTDKTHIKTPDGTEVAYCHAKLFSPMHHTCYVEMVDGTAFEMSREWTHATDIIDIEGLGWQLRGEHMITLNFDLTDAEGNVLAAAHNDLVSLRDVFEVEVYDEEDVDIIAAIFVMFKHMVEQRRKSASDTKPIATPEASA
ncbi:MAG: LURP-one-related family protein [Eggerthellaceae bacterium]|nr:LURP-one-related family protein [Eggerthellaceae bacterium]